MIPSILDNLDNDVSKLIGEYIKYRNNYNNVIKELNNHIKINKLAIYLTGFKVYRHLRFDQRLKESKRLLENKNGNYLYDWPTKTTSFIKLNPNEVIKITHNNYIMKETGWRVKKFPSLKNNRLRKIKII